MDDSSSNYDYDSGYLSNSDVDMSDNEEMRGFDFFPLDLQPSIHSPLFLMIRRELEAISEVQLVFQ